MCSFSVEGKLITWLFLLLSVNCLFVCLFVHLVSTSGRTYQLQAKDKQTMMFWLQELQVKFSCFFFLSPRAFGRLYLGGKSFWEGLLGS